MWFWLSLALAAPVPRVPVLDEAARARLAAQDVIVTARADGTVVHADAVVVIAAPPERIARVIADFVGQADWIPDFDEARIVSTEGGVVVGSGVTRVPWPISDRTWSIRIRSADAVVDGVPAWVSTWTYVPGSGNMNDNSGYWLVMPDGDTGRTLVRYEVSADAALHIPDFIEAWASARMLPEILRQLRVRAEGTG